MTSCQRGLFISRAYQTWPTERPSGSCLITQAQDNSVAFLRSARKRRPNPLSANRYFEIWKDCLRKWIEFLARHLWVDLLPKDHPEENAMY